MKKILSILLLLILGAGGFGYYKYRQATGGFIALTPENIAELKAETAKQNESAFVTPQPQPASERTSELLPNSPENTSKNVYFGDLHIHTSISFDSYLFGNRHTLDDAYAFARGEPLETLAGETMQLSRPLDFVGIADHAETFGMMQACQQMDPNDLPDEFAGFCEGFENPSLGFFSKLRQMGQARPLIFPSFICELFDGDCANGNRDLGLPLWELSKAKAEENNEPGVFTAFAGYEYSPALDKAGKHHRNVFFRNSNTSKYAYSAFDARTAPILWRMLEEDCTGDCEFLTILHNPNKTWGLAYAQHTIDNDAYTDEDWDRRARYEPVVEMFQIKGASECAIGVGTSDEQCAFEQFLPPCKGGETLGCIHPTSMVRDGLKLGLAEEQQLGLNPFKVGLIGSTDTHNANPGDSEEYDYRGMAGIFTSPASKRLAPGRPDRLPLERNPGGLAAVWAVENTRDAIFDSLQAREVYATSGTRIRLNFFGAPHLSGNMESEASPGDMETNPMPSADSVSFADSVPMGGNLRLSGTQAPTFKMMAQMDPMAVPLDRVQVIKGWVKDGKSYESLMDVACSDDRVPDAQGRCPDLDASVDLTSCAAATGKGAAQLTAHWTDPDYDPSAKAFYYLRVLEIPTCRWSTYDAIRLGREPLKAVPATHQERAWSSPIWTERG